MERSEEPASLHNQVEETQLQDKLGKQNFHDKTNRMNRLLIQLKIPLELFEKL